MKQCYVLITPARNEARTIAQTIEAVAAQSVLPRKWVIVSDGSTDKTDEIVKDCAARHPFIHYVRNESGTQRDFGAKVRAILAGYARLNGIVYDFIGNLDADITFNSDYYESLLQKFHIYPKLGIAGGVTYDVCNGRPATRGASLDSVGGAVQMFRRECYEAIGGYLPLPCGMEDSAAVYKAQFLGFECRSFPDLRVLHHRWTGTAGQNIWRARWTQGAAMWAIGWSPWWMLARTVYRMPERPFVLGSCMRTAGYLSSAVQQRPKALPSNLVAFIRNQQHQTLRRRIFRMKGNA